MLNVLDDLIAADWARYRNLAPDWKNLRPRLASDPLLRADAAGLAEFAAWLFWDGQAPLSDLWQKLLAQRSKILRQAAGRPMHCSYEVARLFLDIDAYRKVSQGEGAGTVSGIGYSAGERFCLGAGLPNAVFADTQEFGLWQGLGMGDDAAGQRGAACRTIHRRRVCCRRPTCWTSPAWR